MNPIENDLLKDIILYAPMGICIIDAKTLKPEMVNDNFLKVAGKNIDEVIGKMYWNIFPEAKDLYAGKLDTVISEGRPYQANEVKLTLNRSGKDEHIYVTFVYHPIKDEKKQVAKVGIYVTENTHQVASRMQVEEIVKQRTTELEHTHESLRKANDYLQKIINLINTPLQVLQPVMEKGKIVDFIYKVTNNAYSAYADTNPEDLQEKRVGDIFPGYFQTDSFTKVAKTFETGVADSWEIHYDKDGLDLYNLMSATKMDGEVVVQFTDFTKLKHLQLDLLSKIDELERSNQNLEEFAHAASHDLKEPIRKIQVFTSILKTQLKNQLSDAELNTFARIENASERMGILIDDLLVYSQVAEQPREKEKLDLNEKLDAVTEVLELTIQEKKAKINVLNLPEIKGHGRQIQQMFQNILSNALKYSKPGVVPEINISSELVKLNSSSYHLVSIEDNGIGFDPSYSEKIFQMFTRLHGKSEYGGTGIGLSIVKKVVENHEGFISAESQPGVGSVFKIYFPAGRS